MRRRGDKKAGAMTSGWCVMCVSKTRLQSNHCNVILFLMAAFLLLVGIVVTVLAYQTPHSPSRAHLEERVFGPIALLVGLMLFGIGGVVTYARFRKAKDESLHNSYMARAASALSRRTSLTTERPWTAESSFSARASRSATLSTAAWVPESGASAAEDARPESAAPSTVRRNSLPLIEAVRARRDSLRHASILSEAKYMAGRSAAGSRRARSADASMRRADSECAARPGTRADRHKHKHHDVACFPEQR